MTFSIQKLMNDRVLVKGSDVFGTSGTTTIDATQWNDLNARKDVSKAQEDFDAAVEEFFAPLIEATEKATKSLEKPTDSLSYVVINEGSEGVAATPRHTVALTKDSIILRLIESGDTDRLVWVDDELEVLAASTKQAPATSGTGVQASAETETV